jgi:GAF domain-containing protein
MTRVLAMLRGEQASRAPALAAAALEVDGLALVLAVGGAASELLWCTDEAVRGFEDLQLTLGEGPGLEAARTGAMVAVPDLAWIPHRRWPALAAEAPALAARAVFCFPVAVGAIRLGVLTAARRTPGRLTGGQVGDALALADALAVRCLDGGEPALDGRHGGSAHALTRAVVHQATGMLSVQLAVSLSDALLRLRAYAYSTGRPITEICQDIVDRRLRLGPDGEGTTPVADKD